MREIKFFRLSQSCPVEEFLDSLTSKQAQKMAWVMQLFEEIERISEQYFKKLSNTEGIWEIRVQQGSNIFRILGFFTDKKHFIATNGFQKKTQKTPINEIRLAEKRKIEYLKRER